MTHYQFIVLSSFIMFAIFITWREINEKIQLRKKLDVFTLSLSALYNSVRDRYPEGLHEEDHSMKKAKELLLFYVGRKNIKN